MSDFKFELNSDGVRELLNSQEMISCLYEHAEANAEGEQISLHRGAVRPNVSYKIAEKEDVEKEDKNK